MIDSFAYHFFNFYISDRMAENMKEDLGMAEIEIKEKICLSYRLVETCTEDVQEEDVQMENAEIKGGNL